MSALSRYFSSAPIPVVLARILMAAVFLLYGAVKLTGGQFVYDWTTQTFERGTPGGHVMIWYFFGYSRIYGYFIAMAEIVPALLLIWPRTALLGAAILFAVALNVSILDIAFAVPIPATATVIASTAVLGGLLFHDRRRLLAAFWQVTTAEPPKGKNSV